MNIRPKNRDALSGNLLVGGNSPDAKSLAVLAALDISALIIASAPLPHFRWKLRIVNWLTLMFPISTFVVEDIKARTWKNGRKWNVSFSPLEVGKHWFYSELRKIAHLEIKSGNDTYNTGDQELGLKKSKQKLSNKFEAHCVDSWVLANWYVGGHTQPDNTKLIEVIPRFVSSQTTPSLAAFHRSYSPPLWRHFECGV